MIHRKNPTLCAVCDDRFVANAKRNGTMRLHKQWKNNTHVAVYAANRIAAVLCNLCSRISFCLLL